MDLRNINLETLSREHARALLAENGIPFSQTHFLRHIRSGNDSVVRVYLHAGMSPDACIDGTSALAAAANAMQRRIFELLLKSGADPQRIFDGLVTSKPGKDVWERLSSLSGVFTFVSSLAIAGIGAYFTWSYNRAQINLASQQSDRDAASKEYQNRIAEMQTVEKMIPHLTRDEHSKQAALIAIAALGSEKVARTLAVVYAGEGGIGALTEWANLEIRNREGGPSVAALTDIAKGREDSSSRLASKALGQVLERSREAVVQLFVEVNGRRDPTCNATIVDAKLGLIIVPSYCINLHTGPVGFAVEFNDGTHAQVIKVIPDNRNLLSVLHVKKHGLRDLAFSTSVPQPGASITMLATDLLERKPVAVVGKVSLSGQLRFANYEFKSGRQVFAEGIRLSFDPGQKKPDGSGGSPLFNDQGNAVCIQFQSTQDRRVVDCLGGQAIQYATALARAAVK